jgi:hypothetical protein
VRILSLSPNSRKNSTCKFSGDKVKEGNTRILEHLK